MNSIPFWVPVVFLVLLAAGLRLSRPRRVRPASQLMVAALMGILSFVGVRSAFPGEPLALGAWALAYALVLLGGGPWVGGGAMRIASDGRRVELPGSWLPMALMMGILALKFGLGAATAMQLSLLREAWVAAGLSAALGALSGAFGARALAVCRCALAPTRVS